MWKKPLLFAALLAAAHAAAQDAPFRQWWDLEYTMRDDGLLDYRERREILIGAQSMVQTLAQQRLSVNEHFFDLEIVEAATLKPDGRRIAVAPDKVMTQAATPGQHAIFEADVKVKTVIFPDVAVGDRLILVSFSRQKREQLPGGFSRSVQFSPAARVAAGRVVFDVPKTLKLHTFADRLGYATEAHGDRVRHVWTYAEQPYWRDEPHNVLPLDRAPRVLVSSYRDWEAAGLAYWRRAEPKTVPTAEIAALAEEITRGIGERYAQARAIYEWVANNIRYVAVTLGTGAWVPHDAPTVLAHRYGDCKDKASLMRALLTAKGIESEHALINQRGLYRQYDVPMPAFDHVIVYLPEFDLYADPTSRFSAFGTLPLALFDKPALHSGAKGVRLSRTPRATADANRTVLRAEITIAPDGSAHGTSMTEGIGIPATVLRGRMTEMESQDPEDFGRRLLSQQRLAGSARYEPRSPRDRTDPYAVKASFTITDKPFAAGSSHALAVGPRLISSPAEPMRAVLREGRRYDFVCLATAYREEILLKLPDGRGVARLPADVSERHELAEYSASYRREGRDVRITRDFALRPPGSVCTVETAKALQGVLDAADLDFRRIIRLAEPAASH